MWTLSLPDQDTLLSTNERGEVVLCNWSGLFLRGIQDRECEGRWGTWIDTFVNWNQTVNKYHKVKSRLFVSSEIL